MNAPDSDPDPPCTPPKPTGNGGVCRVDLDGQMESEDDDFDGLQGAKPEQKWNGRMELTLMQRCVTDEKEEMEQEDIHKSISLLQYTIPTLKPKLLVKEWWKLKKQIF